MDVPDLYRFLAQEISKTSDYNPDIIAIDIACDNEKDAKRIERQVQS